MSDNIKELICIICPKGCHLQVDVSNNYKVSNANCNRGLEYGFKELTNPTRTITSTVSVLNHDLHKRLPVKTNAEISKDLIFEAVALLKNITVSPPINVGDVILENILNTNVSFVSAKEIK